MGDTVHYNSDSSEVKTLAVSNNYKRNLIATDHKPFPQNAYKRLASLSHCSNGGGGSPAAAALAIFLLKVAALETVRRVSRSKCPCLWRGIQAMQFICYPPFKWIKKWRPFKGLVKGVQMFSRPLLLLSVATAFSEHSECDTQTSNDAQNNLDSETDPASDPVHTVPDTGTHDLDHQGIPSENWLTQLHKELENQGIALPERIDDDELHRFFTAANGDFLCLLSSVKKTIRWRENYRILSDEELELWSNLVFWHGFDFENRPCLIVRLGLAFLNLPSHERPRFAQAVISQVEHGVLNLVDRDNPRITVLVDCEGISPFRLPMQMLKSCSSLLQDNFPNRLAYLLVIRLPPVVRVIAQTFVQVLKPVTRKKLRIKGKTYHQTICEHLQTIPSFLGGNCACKICLSIKSHTTRLLRPVNEIRRVESLEGATDSDDIHPPSLAFMDDVSMNENWDQLWRTGVISVLMMLVFIALIAELHNPENRLF